VGGTRAKRIDCYGGGLLATDPALAEKTTQLRRQFGAIELSLSGDVQRDLAAIKTVRRAAGEQAPLLVDAGGLYADIAQAQTVGAALEQAEVFWYQEPLPPGRWEEYATLRSALATPLVADKHLFGLKPFAQALQAGALDVALADLRLCGGMSAGRRLADLAWLHDARITFHAGVSGLAQLASAHLIAANWHAGPLQVQPSPAPLTELLDPAPVFKDGFLLLPEQPGLGAQVSEEFLNQYRVEVPQADLELPEDE
jgi:L-alanine-DL-glutamate epimerase-like enolase superfamily enzyme